MVILEEETFKKYSYYPRDLKHKSNKRILVACDDCGKIREIYQSAYRALCKGCVRKGICGVNHPSWKGGQIERVCKVCGVIFFCPPSLIKRGGGLFCSPECYHKTRRGENNPNWKGGKITCTCQYCCKEFSAYKWQKAKYCSKECLVSARSKNYTGESNPNFGKIPSEETRKKISDAIKGENGPNWRGGKIKCKCLTCGEEFESSRSNVEKSGGKYCSRECFGIAHQGENNHNWQGGISYGEYCPKFNEEFKEYIRGKFDRVCFLCGKTEVENGQKLSVHHVNYQKECLCPESEEGKGEEKGECQFIPLCISCHAKVHHDREKWEKFFMDKMRNNLTGWYI